MWTRRSVFDEMSNLFRDFDTLFTRVGEGSRMLPASAARRRELAAGTGETEKPTAWMSTLFPTVECFTRDNQMVLRAEMPGVDPNEVELSVQGDRLTIKGEKKTEHKVEEADYFFQEVDYGKFERSFALPEGTPTDKVKATFRNGVLEVTVPAASLPTAKKVPIEIGPGTGPEKKPVKAA